MTVAELIEKLQKIEDQTRIVIVYGTGEHYKAEFVSEFTTYLSHKLVDVVEIE